MNFIHRENDRTQPNRDQRMGQTSGFVLATGCYRNVPFENRGKGDIIAFRSNYGSGHMAYSLPTAITSAPSFMG